MRCLSALFLMLALPAMAELPAAKIEELAQKHQVTVEQLRAAEALSQKNQQVLDAIVRPWEAKPWYQYRPIFITVDRIEAAMEFTKKNMAALARAEQTYGVQPSIILSIIGVETFYGRHMGNYPVLDATYSLGAYYPKRGEFFINQWAAYVKLAQEQGWDLRSVNGSYAGAMGYGQFIPTSYQHYAVDFDDDGKIDLLNSTSDAIGSVANYLAENGWKKGECISYRLPDNIPSNLQALHNRELKAKYTYRTLGKVGIAGTGLPDDMKVNILKLEGEEHPEWYLTCHNFYVITTYNRSPLYAMAVQQLAARIDKVLSSAQ